MHLRSLLAVAPLACSIATLAAAPPEPKFRAVTLDDKVQIGYGVAIADVDGDKLPDILLADKKQFRWYRNPGPPKPGATEPAPQPWDVFVLAENLTKQDNVCIAAQDIDGDGKCEIAVGAEWNPGDTENSGAVFYLIPPADRTQRWEPVKLHAEPTTHRMRWIRLDSGISGLRDSGNSPSVPGKDPVVPNPEIPKSGNPGISYGLVVVPLHGRGNKNGEGTGARVLLYHPPVHLDDPQAEWTTTLLDDSMHMTHNLEPLGIDAAGEKLLLAGKEGIKIAAPAASWEKVGGAHFGSGEWFYKWVVRADTGEQVIPSFQAATNADFKGAGEVRVGRLPGGQPFTSSVEPMHGNSLAVYVPRINNGVEPTEYRRQVLTDTLIEGHALACGDLLGTGSSQVVVGWRGSAQKPRPVGIRLWTPLDATGEQWRESVIDDNAMACEDLQLADLNGDGKLDVIASGRSTHNLVVYFNETEIQQKK